MSSGHCIEYANVYVCVCLFVYFLVDGTMHVRFVLANVLLLFGHVYRIKFCAENIINNSEKQRISAHNKKNAHHRFKIIRA